MIKEKDKVVNEMMQLISNMNCSDSHCEDCYFKSHCCMCVGALELLYDNGYRKVSKDSVIFTKKDWEQNINNTKKALHYAREQGRKEAAAFILKKIFEESKGYFDKSEDKVYMIICGDIFLSLVDSFAFIEKEKHYEK